MTVRFHLSRTRLIVAVMILAFAWLSPPALANSLTTQANVGSSGGACPGAAYDFETTKPASSSCFFGFNGAPGGIPDNTAGQGFAQSFANYGVLRGFASVAISSLSLSPVSEQASAQATWDDGLSFTNLNQGAILQATISLSGASVFSCIVGPGSTSQCSQADVACYVQFKTNQITSCYVTAVGSCTFFIPIDAKSTVDFSAYLTVDASAEMVEADGISTAEAAYNDTAKVNSLLIVDANGNPILGAGIVSASGTTYNNIASTPEPSTLILMGSGLLALVGIALFKQRSC